MNPLHRYLLSIMLLATWGNYATAALFGTDKNEFTPKRCAGLALCTGAVLKGPSLGSLLFLAPGIYLVTDDTTFGDKLRTKIHDVTRPARLAVLRKIDEKEKNDPSAKNDPVGKFLRHVCS